MSNLDALGGAELILLHISAARTDLISHHICGDIYICNGDFFEYLTSAKLDDLGELKSKLLVVLPFEWCSYKRINQVDTTDFDYLKEHLPYYIEDQVISSLEDVAIFWRTCDSYIDAYIVDRVLYSGLRQSLRKFRFVLQDIFPEQDFLFSLFEKAVLRLHDRIILSDSNGVFLALNPCSADVFLDLPSVKGIYPILNVAQDRESFFRGRQIALTAGRCSLLEKDEQWFRRVGYVLSNFEPFLRGVCAGCLIFSVYLILAGSYFSSQHDAVRQQMAAIFPKKLGPDRNMSEVESLARSQLRDHGRIVQYQFLRLLQFYAQARNNVNAVEVRIESVRFSGRGLLLGLVFQDFGVFQRLITELKKLASVDVKEINNQDGSLRVTVTIY